jgi:hypothetical protein
MKLELKWVIIIFAVHIFWHILTRALGLYGDRSSYEELSLFVFAFVYALLMLLALLDLRSRNKGYLNRRHGFSSGLFISFILVVLSPLMVAILAFGIQPDFFNIMISNSIANGEYLSYEAAASEYSYWNYVQLYMATYLLVGSLSGALWAYLLHKVPMPVTD